ncbi:hypothetical protein TNCV_5109501 [Trichonephila clavipes]|nr:hypothetical protein TNCV_5109501 [Trichonephila clavipes]
MAEGIVNASEEQFSYFCHPCRNRCRETERIFIAVSSVESCFLCVKCREIFYRGFKTEKLNTTDTLPHRCNNCGWTFRKSSELLYHSYRHSNQWPHRCSFCQKGFAIHSHLEHHKLVQNLKCESCLHTFRGRICPHWLSQLTLKKEDLMCEKCSNGSSPIQYVKSKND